MLTSTATLIKEAIDKKIGHSKFSVEEIAMMRPLHRDINDGGYTIYGIQSGDLTILVWLQIRNGDVCVRSVKTLGW